MENKKNKLNNLLFAMGLLVLMGLVGGVTFAFFNYAYAGDTNDVVVGDIEFHSNLTNVTIQNVFPIASSDVDTKTDKIGSVTITVNGNTTYDNGVEYLISFDDVNITAGGKQVPVDIIVTTSNLGNEEANYFSSRTGNSSIYKVLSTDTLDEDKRIVVGYIPQNSNVTNGLITIKAFVNEDKVIVTDTYQASDGENSYGTTADLIGDKVVLTSSEWRELKSNPVSFKILVDARSGIWVDELKTLKSVIASKVSSTDYVKNYTITNSSYTTQDTVGTNSNKEDVLYYTGANAVVNGNVLFGGYCWQIVRTTDNGGVRLIYNGVAQNNKCLDSRSETTWKGVNGANYESKNIQGNYFYADNFDYDLETGKFKLINIEENKRSWSYAQYKTFIGKYTCLEDKVEGCDNIYFVSQYINSTNALVEKYSIGNVSNYRHIGASVFNSGYMSPANVGYMFNEIYPYNSGVTTNAIYGKNIKYENGNYTVYNDDPNETINTTEIDEYHHYSCGTTTTCQTVKYYYVSYNDVYYYMKLTGGDTELDILKKMVNYKKNQNEEDVNINVYNSTIKGYLENWYNKNLKEYENYIDTNAVYCNDRTIINLGGWNKTNGTYSSNWLQFRQYNVNTNLSCQNETDRFSMNNPKAKIDAPIGLITEPERGLMGTTYAATGNWYWGLSPYCFTSDGAVVRYVGTVGSTNLNYVYVAGGVRAAITLKPGTEFVNGDGTKNSPYQIGDLVIRNVYGKVE